jgi:hypothetical protein
MAEMMTQFPLPNSDGAGRSIAQRPRSSRAASSRCHERLFKHEFTFVSLYATSLYTLCKEMTSPFMIIALIASSISSLLHHSLG